MLPGEEFAGEIPDNASCASCQYSEMLPVGTDLKKQRICRRFPPQVFAIAQIQGGQTIGFQLSAAPPPVDASQWCYEYDARQGPEIEPTALLLGGPAKRQ